MQNFPIIKTIDDVLPHIKGYDEFVVAERPYGTVINYIIALKETFAGEGHAASIRKECRGLVFDKNGKIVSRPFHKFFNLGEREETFLDNLDLEASYEVMEKLDGSMIRPIRNELGVWQMGTRMGITDIAGQADIFVMDVEHANTFFDYCESAGITPIFEWCSRQQRIVIDHPKDRLVLTAIRQNFIGSYFSQSNVKALGDAYGFEVVQTFDDASVYGILNRVETDKELEGWVVRWGDGHMIKVKLDWYVALHKTKEAISREKYVIEMILSRNLDDVKGRLQSDDLQRVEKFEYEFNAGFVKRAAELGDLYKEVREAYPTKKDFALAPSDPRIEPWKSLFFALWDGKTKHILHGLIGMISSRIKSQPMIDENRWMWYGATYCGYGVPEE